MYIFAIAKEIGKSNNRDLNLINVLKTMASFNEKLIALLGEDNQRLIVTDPPENSSAVTKNVRIDALAKYIKMMYERRNVNVPTIDSDFSLRNGKIINVNIGNFTDPINLTYGERTGACMRIGGAGDELFDFCLENEAGFHIRFSTPNGDFISRVSGFRVGNTVFLNELRNSLIPEYSDADVLEVCKMVSEEMIRLSQNSESPIENVVAHNDYILKFENPSVNFQIDFPKDGKKVPRYFDIIPKRCVLIATSNNDKTREFVPFKDTSLPKYQVLRNKVKILTDSKEINYLINRVRMNNEIIGGCGINEITLDEEQQFKLAYVGEDFYITVDTNNNIDTYIMPNSRDNERALLEIKSIKDKLKQLMVRTDTLDMTEETFSSTKRREN